MQQRKAVLCLVLDEAGMTAFQVTARVWFEQSLYKSIQHGEYLITRLFAGTGQRRGTASWRRRHMVPRNGGRMDHGAALLHGELPLLQLPLRLRTNVRLPLYERYLRRAKRLCLSWRRRCRRAAACHRWKSAKSSA